MGKKRLSTARGTKTADLQKLPPYPIPVVMRPAQLKAFSTAVELHMKKTSKMIEALIEYNKTCTEAAKKLARAYDKA